jgi:hypothetical protein
MKMQNPVAPNMDEVFEIAFNDKAFCELSEKVDESDTYKFTSTELIHFSFMLVRKAALWCRYS